MWHLRERESDSRIDLDFILSQIIKLESNLDFEALCHSEGVRSTTEESKTNFLDTSAFAKPQYDKNFISSTITSDDSIDSPSLAEGVRGWVKNLTALLKSLPTPPKNGWEQVNVDNVLSLEYGKTLQEAKRIEGEYPVMGSNGIVGYHNEYIVQAPNIIVGRKGSAGKITFIEKNCYPIDTTFYVQLKAQYNVKLLYYVLKLLNLEKDKGGTGAPGINRNDIYKLKIPLPPLSEQNKIIAPIEWIESKITTLDSALSALESTKSKILQKYL